EVDPRGAVPPYEQLREQVAALVRSGALAPGTRLPTIRQLANDLGLAGGTVARAYRELEAAGLVVTRGRHGTEVAPQEDPVAEVAELLSEARRYASQARRLGAPVDQALAAVRAAYALGTP
ncbi:MAG: transcriptional regulator GntR family, partial [Acidimicrobiales bacterium]|nr:transcriptional regulator GntR family [Acidimicrobiales bacterium]